MRIGSLFSGYGGLDQGVAAALGLTHEDVAWVSDVDPAPCKILAHRYPYVPNIGDVTAVDWASVEPVDVITGGSPCQDLSMAGRRAGMRPGTRSGLWESMREAIATIRPGLVVWENVRGALSAGAVSAVEQCPGCVGDDTGGALRALGRVLGDLADLGYDAQWHGLRAADVGAPHGRFRIFVVAYPDGEHRGERRLAAPGQAAGGRPFGQLAGRGRAPAADADRAGLEGLAGPQGAAPAGRHGHPQPRPGRPDLTLLPTLRTENNENRQSSGFGGVRGNFHGLVTGAVSWGDYADAVTRWEAVTRPAPSPTEPGAKGRPRLSPRFAEWMMGLPAGWVCDVPGITRTEALKALGNGVVPHQAARAVSIMLDRAAMCQEKAA